MSITPNLPNLINYLSNLTQTSTQTSSATTRPVPNIHQNDRIQIAIQHDIPTARPIPTIPEHHNSIRSNQITIAVDEENQNQNSAKSNTCNPFYGLAIISIIELCIAVPMANCKFFKNILSIPCPIISLEVWPKNPNRKNHYCYDNL